MVQAQASSHPNFNRGSQVATYKHVDSGECGLRALSSSPCEARVHLKPGEDHEKCTVCRKKGHTWTGVTPRMKTPSDLGEKRRRHLQIVACICMLCLDIGEFSTKMHL
ncbi:hypothetical protein FKM82_021569 [Ascaphus truei]